MNSIEHIRHELRRLTALDYAARLRRELRLTPGDPDLHWALHELQAELDTLAPPQPYRRLALVGG